MLEGKTILEVGTGSGAFLSFLLCAKEVYGIDVSDAGLSIAKQVYQGKKNIHIVKSDLMNFQGAFDLVIADQVLHHLPDTFQALKKTVSLLKPRGYILFYVYRKKGRVREFFDDFTRLFTTRMSTNLCLSFSRLMCTLGHVLSHLNLHLQRAIYWNMLKCFWNENFMHENNVRVNFDWYHPPIAHRHTTQEVLVWINALGLKVQMFKTVESGISVVAQR